MTKQDVAAVSQLIAASVAFGVWQGSVAAGLCFYFGVTVYSIIANRHA